MSGTWFRTGPFQTVVAGADRIATPKESPA